MPSRSGSWRLALLLLTLVVPSSGLGAQTAYAALGVGPTPVLDGGSGNRNWFGTAGFQGRGSIGGRVSATETASRLWLSADIVYQPGSALRPVRPYALAGVGMAVDFGDTDPVLTAGAGVRARLQSLLFLFAEARVQTIPGSPASGPDAILPITIGLGLGR
jgi:hypothetical protein